MGDNIPVPSDLGFDPIKFPSYRENQLEVATQAASTNKFLFLAELPTGTGKSLGGLTTFQLLQRDSPTELRGAYLVGTKALQDQVQNDFNLPVLKGKANYRCAQYPKLFPSITAEACTEILDGEGCPKARLCEYQEAKRVALSSPMSVWNYALFLTMANYTKGFKRYDFLIADEIDTCDSHLASFVDVTISSWVNKTLKLGLPHYRTKPLSWADWLQEVEGKVGDYILILEQDVKMGLATRVNQLTRMRRLRGRITYLIETLNTNWVMEIIGLRKNEDFDPNSPPSVVFRPVKVNMFGKNYLWKHAQKSLGMSATILGNEAMAMELGLNSWDVEGVSLPSPFPVETREVWYEPVADVVYENKGRAYPALVKKIDKILNNEAQSKVLIHGVSYDLTRYLAEHLKPHHHEIITHSQGDRVEMLERFKKCKNSAALLSPSMERGVDLAGDLGLELGIKEIIVAKIPYLNLKSPQVNKRLYGFPDGSVWYARKAVRALLQSTGRATRSLGDFSRSHILDSQFEKLYDKNRKLFPEWWRQALCRK